MKKNSNQNPFKYYFVGTQIALIVLVAVFLGYQIDKFFNNTQYVITIIISIVSIFYALFTLINDVNKEK